MSGAHDREEDQGKAAAPLDILRRSLPGNVRVLEPDQHLRMRGQGRDVVIGVLSGMLRCFRLTADGRRHIARFARPGGLIGVGALAAFRSSIEAVSVSSVIEFQVSDLDALCVEDAAARHAVVQAMTAELVLRDRIQFRLGRLWADERVADFLLEVAQVENGGLLSGALVMSRADIADYLGATIETVSRALSRLQREGLIRLEDAHHFTVLRRPALQALACGDSDARAYPRESGRGLAR